MTDRHFRVAIVQPPFIELNNETRTYDGFCIDLINLLSQRQNFTYELYESPDGTYGTRLDNGSWTGLIQELILGNAQIALAAIPVNAERNTVIDFTFPFYDDVSISAMMKVPGKKQSPFTFAAIFEWQVWIAFFVATLLTTILLWAAIRYSPNAEAKRMSAGECIWFCLMLMTPISPDITPKAISCRLIVISWWLFGFMILTSYTANLATMLTADTVQTPIRYIDDLINQFKIKYSTLEVSSSATFFKRMAQIEQKFSNQWIKIVIDESTDPMERARMALWEFPISDKYSIMWQRMQATGFPKTFNEAVQRVLESPSATEGFVFLDDSTSIDYAVMQNCDLEKLPLELATMPYALAVQKGSPLEAELSSAILALQNDRHLERLKAKWWDNNPLKVDCPKVGTEMAGLTIQNIGGIYMVLAAGFIITLITMGFELKLCRQKSNNVVVKVVKISAAAELPNNDKTDKTVAGAKEQK